jgi:hypothetical protein
MMSRIQILGLGLAVLLTAAGCATDDTAQPAAEWQSLFDGSSLDGWHNPYDWGEAWVEDGEIRLVGDRKFFLVTDETYGDFDFEAEVLMPEGVSNSGFMFRAHVAPNEVTGYQAEVDPSERKWSGGLYDEGRRGWLHPVREDSASVAAFLEQAGDAFDRYGWNRYRIRAVGETLQIYLNDVLTTDYADTLDRSGHLAVQHHGEAGQIYRFRNIRVRQL